MSTSSAETFTAPGDESTPRRSADPAQARQRERLQLVREMDLAKWISEAAGISYCGIFAGCCSDRALRLVRVRELILVHKLANRQVITAGRENFCERFERLYGEPLVPRDTQLKLQSEVTP